MLRTTTRYVALYLFPLWLMCFVTANPAVAVESGGESEPSLYVDLDEPIIVNIFTRRSIHFLRVTTQLKLSDPTQAGVVKTHLAPIKHDLILLLSGKKYYQLQTVKGKSRLRKQALELVRKIMKEKTGEPLVENIFFTSIILQ